MPRRGVGIQHCPCIIVWEHHFSTTALPPHPQEAVFSNTNHYVMEAAAGQGWKHKRSQWAQACSPWGAQAQRNGSTTEAIGNKKKQVEVKKGPIFDLLFSREIYRSWNLIKASFGGLSKTQTSKINLFFFTAFLCTCPFLHPLFYLKICVSQHSIWIDLKEHMWEELRVEKKQKHLKRAVAGCS